MPVPDVFGSRVIASLHKPELRFKICMYAAIPLTLRLTQQTASTRVFEMIAASLLACSADVRVQVLKEYIANTEISEHRPWMLQQLLRGREYSSYSVAHEGQLVMHSDNEACLSCLDYAHINSKQVDFWYLPAMLLRFKVHARGAGTPAMALLYRHVHEPEQY